MNTGLESHIESRADTVEEIISPTKKIQFKQIDQVHIWRYKEALEGKTEIEYPSRQVKVPKDVDYPDRHWWIITDGLMDNLDPSFRDHADIFDLILAINLCINEPVSLTQSPGQTIGGAYRVRQNALDYRGDLSMGSFPLALLTMNEIPEVVRISDSIEEIYEMVRRFRSTSIEHDEDMDIRIGLHMYDDALATSLWTTMSNLFFVCENILCSGQRSNPVSRIAEVTDMNQDEARNWKNTVNRLKHPDKGDVTGLVEQPDLEVPTLRYMRATTNTALIHVMRQRFEQLSDGG